MNIQVVFEFFEEIQICRILRRAAPSPAAGRPDPRPEAVAGAPPGGRSPLGFLLKVRHSSLPHDAILILLAIAHGVHRWSDIRDATGLLKWQMTRMLAVLAERGLIERQEDLKAPGGPGKCCHYHLSGPGVGAVREVLSSEPVTLARRPLPAGVSASLRVRGENHCFLGE